MSDLEEEIHSLFYEKKITTIPLIFIIIGLFFGIFNLFKHFIKLILKGDKKNV